MTSSTTQFQIEQLRAKNLQEIFEATFGLLLSIFVSVLLPTILIRFIYANQQLMEEPVLLQLIPLVAFVFGLLLSLKAVVMNMRRSMIARRLEAELLRGDVRSSATKASTSDLQVALSRVESASTKTTKAKTTRAKKTKARRK